LGLKVGADLKHDVTYHLYIKYLAIHKTIRSEAIPNTPGITPKMLLKISAPPSSTSSMAVPPALIVSANA